MFERHLGFVFVVNQVSHCLNNQVCLDTSVYKQPSGMTQ